MINTKTISEGIWTVEETTFLRELTIAEGASIAASKGKYLTMSVNGVSVERSPCVYKGDIVLTVSEKFVLVGENPFLNGRTHDLRPALCIEDGKIIPEKGISAILKGGKITASHIDNVTIRGCDEGLNGIVIDGDSEVVINNLTVDFEGDNASEMINDFIGVGSAVACYGNSKVTINDSRIRFTAVTRCTIHAAGHSNVTCNNCELICDSPATIKMDPNWCIGLRGTNRATQLCEYATVRYNNCYIKSNGWGVMSIDGNIDNRMYLKNCVMELSGTRARGYGAFAIGVAYISLDHCECPVNGYSILMHTERDKKGRRGYVEYVNGTSVTGNLNGMLVFGDDCGMVKISDSSFNTAESVFAIKGSATQFDIDNSELHADNGTIFSIFDNDDPGMGIANFKVPIGKVDEYVKGRDLATTRFDFDVIANLSNMEVEGNFFNSSTNLLQYQFGDKDTGHSFHRDEGETGGLNVQPRPVSRADTPELRGPKNFELNLKNTVVKGMISSCTAKYREGVEIIDASNREELGNIIQTPAPTINNGMIVTLDAESSWVVTGTSYITKLIVAEGASVKALEFYSISMTVDGKDTPIAAGEYVGKIVLAVK